MNENYYPLSAKIGENEWKVDLLRGLGDFRSARRKRIKSQIFGFSDQIEIRENHENLPTENFSTVVYLTPSD